MRVLEAKELERLVRGAFPAKRCFSVRSPVGEKTMSRVSR